jgi:hypothetical protein
VIENQMIVAKGNRIKIAVFRDEKYDSSAENHLIAEGFFTVSIKNPKPADLRRYPDFILAPECSCRMAVFDPAFLEIVLSSQTVVSWVTLPPQHPKSF